MYDIKASEQYLFLPHIGLGRIRSHTLQSFIANQDDAGIVLTRIKRRIQVDVSEAIIKIISQKNNTLFFDTISILKLPQKERVYSVTLSKKRLRQKLKCSSFAQQKD